MSVNRRRALVISSDDDSGSPEYYDVVDYPSFSHDDYEPDDPYTFYGLSMTDMMLIAGACFSLILIITLIYIMCAKSPEEEDAPKVETVVIKEIRPGLIFVQGNPTSAETLRIIQEYDAMRGHPSTFSRFTPPCPYGAFDQVSAHTHSMDGACNITPASSCTVLPGAFVQPPTVNLPPQHNLIDLPINDQGRPPPYAPAEVQRQ